MQLQRGKRLKVGLPMPSRSDWRSTYGETRNYERWNPSVQRKNGCGPSMQMLLKLLRRSGVTIPRREVDAAPWTIALLESASSGRLTLQKLAVGPDKPPIAELYGARVKSVDRLHLTLIGIEQSNDAAVVQEWRLKKPPELGGEGLTAPAAQGIVRRARGT